jgi:branched-chain amino acid transport system ATP-binding protein
VTAPTQLEPGPTAGGAPPALALRGVHAGYDKVAVLRGVDLVVRPGQVVTLLGPNGAGKTTLLRTAAGLLRPSAGSVAVGDRDVTRQEPNARARAGICLIPEGRGVFRNLTVADNLRISSPPWLKKVDQEAAYTAFPILRDRRAQLAGTLSGGQQQMLALARAILAEASVVLVDEVSMGLAPIIVDVIFEALHTLAQRGVALLVVEQYVDRALAMADSVYLIKKGEVRHAGPPSALSGSSLIEEYLGTGAASSASAE